MIRAPRDSSRLDALRSRLRREHLWTLITIALAVVWFIWLRPGFLGGTTGYVFVSGSSMEPSLDHGDLVVTRKQDTYSAGDVVAFRVPEGEAGAGALVIHRIVGGSAESGYVMQGDNRNRADLWRPAPDDIIGKRWLHVPGGGRVIRYLVSPFVLGLIAAVVAAYLALGLLPRKNPHRS